MNAPSPGLPTTSLFLLDSASGGEEWADAEVVAVAVSSEKGSVSIRGPGWTAKDWSIRETPVGTVVTRALFVPWAEGCWTAVELFKSSGIPEGAEWSEGGEEAGVPEKGIQESHGPEEFCCLAGVVSSPISKPGGDDWLKTEVAATWVCTVTSPGSLCPPAGEPCDVPSSV